MTPASERLSPPSLPIGRRLAARLIDDAILVGLAVGIAMATTILLTRRAMSSDSLSLSDYYGLSEGGYAIPIPPAAPALVLGFVALSVVAYYLWASAAGGRTLGRWIFGLRVVRETGGPVSWGLLLGREGLRTTLLIATLSLAWLVARAIEPMVAELPTQGPVGVLLQSCVSWLPLVLVAIAWLGATLVDPLGRAPHDRLAGTIVTSAASPTIKGAP